MYMRLCVNNEKMESYTTVVPTTGSNKQKQKEDIVYYLSSIWIIYIQYYKVSDGLVRATIARW